MTPLWRDQPARHDDPGRHADDPGLPALLARYAGGDAGGWRVSPTVQGEMRASFLATRPGRRLFLKRPAEPRGAARLAELGVTPPLVAAGAWRGEPFVLHEWIVGRTPDRAWLRLHAAGIARLMRRYHGDAPLRAALAAGRPPYPVPPGDHPAHLARELAALAAGLAAAAAPEFRDPAVRAAIRRFRGRAGSLPPGPLVPTHGDPNPANLLLADDTVFLVDWDAAAPSDPLRDLALFAWWFLPPAEWPAFFLAYDGEGEPGGPSRASPDVVGWWAARGSLRVALWLDAHGRDPGMLRSFLADFLAAEAGAPNPKLAPEG